MTVTLALAGDTMLGRGVGAHLADHRVRDLFGDALLEVVHGTDGVVLNLECCVSARGRPWPGRVFHFRAPPRALEALTLLGVRCVTLANNHALDYGVEALLDTIDLVRAVGIAVTGAGEDETEARAPARVTVGGQSLTVVGVTDHPEEYAAGTDRPGVAWADLPAGVPGWVTDAVAAGRHTGAVLVTPHWGPNMTREPPAHVRAAARALVTAGATLVAGHSAHVFHGAAAPVLFDLGDFLDDYAVDPRLRNDLGVLWLVTLDGAQLARAEAVPLRLEYAHTDVATGDDARWVERRMRRACSALGSTVTGTADRLELVLP
ncbi:CapA family protein [Oryzihumus sp.]|uniref:CapA family protein n=1 Tax=Oryzihumus sp. TaxID=1968903 RepID=UPI002ED9EA9C